MSVLFHFFTFDEVNSWHNCWDVGLLIARLWVWLLVRLLSSGNYLDGCLSADR